MKKVVLILAVMLSLMVVSLLALTLPKPEPLNIPLMDWMQGQWQSTCQGPLGMTDNIMTCSLELEGQFFMVNSTSTAPGITYSGMGIFTVDLETGEHVGYWVDNYRGRYEGKGRLEGENKAIMELTGTMGTSTRITEKLSDNRMKVTIQMPGPDGTIVNYTGEYTRVQNASQETNTKPNTN